MAQLATRRLYAASEPLLARDIDAFIDDLEVFVNVVGLNDDNILDAGITASTKIDDGSLTGEKFVNSVITTAKIADSNITRDKIEAGAITTAKIDDLAITTAKLDGGSVTTAKIAASNVTGAKLETALKTLVTLNMGSSTIASSTSTYTTIGSATATITTQGGPVLILGTAGDFGYTHTSATTHNGEWICELVLRRSTSGSVTDVASYNITQMFNSVSGAGDYSYIPFGGFKHLDTVSAGTHIYYLDLKHSRRTFLFNNIGTTSTGTSYGDCTVTSGKLTLKELI